MAKVITTFLSSNAFIILTPFIALSQLIPVIKISFMGCIRKWTTNTQLGTSGDGRQDCNWSDSTVFLIFRTSNAFRDSFCPNSTQSSLMIGNTTFSYVMIVPYTMLRLFWPFEVTSEEEISGEQVDVKLIKGGIFCYWEMGHYVASFN